MSGRMKLFLDLDNTLISSEPLCDFDSKKYKNKAVKFDFHDMDDYYVVFERPGLQDFLDYVFDNFDVSVWTAASREYGLFIIKNIILTKPNRKLQLYFFTYHCDWSEKNNRGHKGLSLIWEDMELPGFTPENTIIIDDLSEIKEDQPCNAIHIKPFEFTNEGSQNDNELIEVQKKLEWIKNNRGSCPTGDSTYKPKKRTPRKKTRKTKNKF
jgi:TFIIF-interacting CTD phosphatase-like protein